MKLLLIILIKKWLFTFGKHKRPIEVHYRNYTDYICNNVLLVNAMPIRKDRVEYIALYYDTYIATIVLDVMI